MGIDEAAPLTLLTTPGIPYHHCWMACKDQEEEITVIECGSYSGHLANHLMYSMRLLKPGVTIDMFAMDTFSGFPYEGKEQTHHKAGDLCPPGGMRVVKMLHSVGVVPCVGRVEETLPVLLEDLGDRRIDFVFVDLDMLVPTKLCTKLLAGRIKVGGRIGYHDYDHDPKYVLRSLAVYIDKVFRNNPKWEEVKRKKSQDHRFVFFERIAE